MARNHFLTLLQITDALIKQINLALQYCRKHYSMHTCIICVWMCFSKKFIVNFLLYCSRPFLHYFSLHIYVIILVLVLFTHKRNSDDATHLSSYHHNIHIYYIHYYYKNLYSFPTASYIILLIIKDFRYRTFLSGRECRRIIYYY